jgi:hypothetical protein
MDHIDVQFNDTPVMAPPPAVAPPAVTTPPVTLPATATTPVTIAPPATSPVTLPTATPALGITPSPELVAAAARFGLTPSTEIDYNKLGLPAGKYVIPGDVTPPDPAKIADQEATINGLNRDLIIKEQRIREMKADAAQSSKLAAANEYAELQDKIKAANAKLEELKKGTREKDKTISVSAPPKPQKPQPFDFNTLPQGHPARFLAGMLGGMGGSVEDISNIVSPIFGAAGPPLGAAAGGIMAGIAGVPLPGPMGYPGVPTAPSTELNQLAKEGNPLVLAQMAGINVPDYSRAGGGPQDLLTQEGPASDAMGRMYSDTSALIDRTFTNMDAAAKARHDQSMAVLNEVRDRLAGDYVGPVTEQAVASGVGGMADGAAQAIGVSMGQAAGPIIASAVNGATAGQGAPGTGAGMVTTGVGAVTSAVGAIAAFADGGGVFGGTPGKDSVPALLMPNEYVLTTADVARMGGIAGVDQFRRALWGGKVRGFATGGGVDVTSSVGAEFFGVGQVPILSTIVDLLIAVLLKVIGVQIEARDSLNEISSDFREYRGDFKAFDAAGRMMNDTSGLLDRSTSSEQAAADERIRVLKLVLEGLFKFIVEKIIVPMAKAVGNSLLQAASSAVSGGMATLPGGSIYGPMVGNLINSMGSAGIDIASEIGTIVAESVFSIGQDAIAELLQSMLPGLTNSVFGGGALAALFDPITDTITNLGSGLAMLFTSVFGGLATVVPGVPFDEGGVAAGTGLMPKATIRPERVLSPRQTESFDRLVSALTSDRPTRTTTIHAPFTVQGGERGGREARDRLLALMS